MTVAVRDVRASRPPDAARLVADPAGLAYLDCQTALLPRPMTPLELWDAMMARPLPGLGLSFAIRDRVSRLFGVRPIGGFSGRRSGDARIGDRLDFFRIAELSPTQMVLTAEDRHLQVMVSVDMDGPQTWITASVVTLNAFGRAYMIPVGLVHPAIVRAMLRRMEPVA